MTPMMPSHAIPARHRTLFLSDLHLGALGCRADLILDFLTENLAETYFLVGDILELGHPRLPHWTSAHQAVIDHLVARAAAGARLVYLVGNHDPEPDRAHRRRRLPAVPVTEAIHQSADGRRFLVLHGDIVDSRLLRAHLVTRIGSRIDHGLRRLDNWLRTRRYRARSDARSAIEALLNTVNMLLCRGHAYQRHMVELARRRGLDGVICGHFHIADLHEDLGLLYANCGDWVDSFTALAEGMDGHLRLLGGRELLLRAAEAAQATTVTPVPVLVPAATPAPVHAVNTPPPTLTRHHTG